MVYKMQREGITTIENLPDELECDPGYVEGDFQLEVADNGVVWINLNGVCLLRFHPKKDGAK